MDEVGSALIATTLVLIAVFVPTAFVPGISGQFLPTVCTHDRDRDGVFDLRFADTDAGAVRVATCDPKVIPRGVEKMSRS